MILSLGGCREMGRRTRLGLAAKAAKGVGDEIAFAGVVLNNRALWTGIE